MFSYLPLAHGYETAVEFALMILGSRITYYSGSLHMLVDDLKYAKPSLFIAVPRVLQNIPEAELDQTKDNTVVSLASDSCSSQGLSHCSL